MKLFSLTTVVSVIFLSFLVSCKKSGGGGGVTPPPTDTVVIIASAVDPSTAATRTTLAAGGPSDYKTINAFAAAISGGLRVNVPARAALFMAFEKK